MLQCNTLHDLFYWLVQPSHVLDIKLSVRSSLSFFFFFVNSCQKLDEKNCTMAGLHLTCAVSSWLSHPHPPHQPWPHDPFPPHTKRTEENTTIIMSDPPTPRPTQPNPTPALWTYNKLGLTLHYNRILWYFHHLCQKKKKKQTENKKTKQRKKENKLKYFFQSVLPTDSV